MPFLTLKNLVLIVFLGHGIPLAWSFGVFTKKLKLKTARSCPRRTSSGQQQQQPLWYSTDSSSATSSDLVEGGSENLTVNTRLRPGSKNNSRTPSTTSTDERNSDPTSGKSRILSLSCYNLAGAVSPNNDGGPIQISLTSAETAATAMPAASFVACTGETGSGKSLLFARALELLTGHRATDSIVGGGGGQRTQNKDMSAFVEMELLLMDQSHLAFAKAMLSTMGVLDASSSSSWNDDQPQRIRIRRELMRATASNNRGKKAGRLRSLCTVNGTPVTLKAMTALMTPLLVVVDASNAASALGRPEARLAMLDTGIDPTVRQFFVVAQRAYRQCRNVRLQLEEDLANRLLPQSFSMDTKEDVELVNHWISEIDAFSARVFDFIERLSADEIEDGSVNSLKEMIMALQETDWMENAAEKGKPFVSALYERLKALRDTVRSLDTQITSAANAAAILSSFSLLDSAVTAVEKSRNFLFDASDGNIVSDRLEEASETSHDLLNQAEVALSKCARFIEEDDRGLLATLEALRAGCPVSVDAIDELILDWNGLARKHNISPLTLPSCHKSMINERDGNVEALSRLPKAVAAEKAALEKFQNACQLLSTDRKRVTKMVRDSVNRRLPSLSMASSNFDVEFSSNARQCTDAVAITGNMGLDSVQFMLHHAASSPDGKESLPIHLGGAVDKVASSGEKARILLAIECSLPGSIRAAASSLTLAPGVTPPSTPIAVVYDEIDAHVGGRAAVALGHMLADQSHHTQVIAITHSPAVAASADAHIVVQKKLIGDQTLIDIEPKIDALERRQELARMASGDVAVEEAEIFADALLRDGLQRRRQQKK